MKKFIVVLLLLLVLGCSAPAPAIPEADTCRVYDLALDNPTYDQVVELLNDFDPQCVLVHEGSECMDYAYELQQDATKRGLWCKLALFNLDKGGHVGVAFDTKDKGLIIIDPQYKTVLEIRDGKLFNDGKEVATVIYWRIYN